VLITKAWNKFKSVRKMEKKKLYVVGPLALRKIGKKYLHTVGSLH